MEIEEDNRLIAEFMTGQSKNSTVFFNYNCSANDLKFHSSWDWLMPVLIKIERLGYGWRLEVNVSIGRVPFYHCTIGSFYTMAGISALDATYGAVVEFIKLYNPVKH